MKHLYKRLVQENEELKASIARLEQSLYRKRKDYKLIDVLLNKEKAKVKKLKQSFGHREQTASRATKKNEY